MKRHLLGILLMLGLGVSAPAQASKQVAGSERPEVSQRANKEFSAGDPRLREAALLQEIILAYLSQKDYAAILPEYRKLLGLGLGKKYEDLLVEGTWGIANALRQQQQFDLAHQILDDTRAQTHKVDNIVTLLLLKGKIYKDEGLLRKDQDLLRKAVDTFREAVKLKPSLQD